MKERKVLSGYNRSPAIPFKGLRLLLLALLCLSAPHARAQTPSTASPPGRAYPAPGVGGTPPLPSRLKVATRIVPPFVLKEENGDLGGFSIELWNEIARELRVTSTYSPYSSVKELLSAVHAGREDLGIAAISITADREKEFDFSQPMFESGLQILVRGESGGDGGTPSFWSVLFSPIMLQLLAIIALLVIIPAHLLWLFERHHDEGIVENKAYFPGIFKATWWAAGTLGAQADEMPRSWLGRIIAIVWMFLSIAFVSYFTATITTAMTVQRLSGNIQGPGDLPGKRVATVAGSTSEAYLRDRRVRLTTFDEIQGAFKALDEKQVDAVVYDAPVLLYYAAQEGQGKAQVVGNIFRKEDYGVVFRANSPLRKPVNRALLTLKENGTLEKLYARWFTTEADSGG